MGYTILNKIEGLISTTKYKDPKMGIKNIRNHPRYYVNYTRYLLGFIKYTATFQSPCGKTKFRDPQTAWLHFSMHNPDWNSFT